MTAKKEEATNDLFDEWFSFYFQYKGIVYFVLDKESKRYPNQTVFVKIENNKSGEPEMVQIGEDCKEYPEIKKEYEKQMLFWLRDDAIDSKENSKGGK